MADIQQKPKIQDDPSVLEVYGNKLVSNLFRRRPPWSSPWGQHAFFPERIDEMPQQGTTARHSCDLHGWQLFAVGPRVELRKRPRQYPWARSGRAALGAGSWGPRLKKMS